MKVVWGELYVEFGVLYSNSSWGGLLELDGVLFVLGLKVNFLSVSALEDVGYCVLFKREHVFIYR
jgi:hypothetical protein